MLIEPKTLEARPTTYKKTLLRSKSEAIFIRGIELMGFEDWEYEPEDFRVGDWTPDFWVVGSHYDKEKSKRIILSWVIEYKPAPVTPSYKGTLSERFLVLLSKDRLNLIHCVLACGSPFDSEIPKEVWSFDYHDGWELVPNSWLFKRIDEAKNYRFDLE